MNWDAQSDRAAIRYYSDWCPDGIQEAHRRGARWQREALLSDKSVELAARGIHASHDRGWHFDAEDHAVQDEYLDMARAALAAALGEDEAAEGIERIRQRGIGIGQEMARETMQASIGDAVRKLQEIAWDEGAEAFQAAAIHPRSTLLNPYREDEGDE